MFYEPGTDTLRQAKEAEAHGPLLVDHERMEIRVEELRVPMRFEFVMCAHETRPSTLKAQ